MESQLILKTPILFAVSAKKSSFPNKLNIFYPDRKSWHGEEKQCVVALRLRRPPQQRFTTIVNKHVGNIIIVKNNVSSANNVVPEYDNNPSNNNMWDSFRRNLDVFCRFARVHVVFGRVLCVISIFLLTIEKMSDFSPLFFTHMILVSVAAAFMSIYISGVNHLCDIEIDKVNKPQHPIASGKYSVKTGALMVVSAALMSLSIPMFLGSWQLFWGHIIGCLIFGFGYSVDLPLLRWKRTSLMTAISMALNKCTTQIAFYMHVQTHVFGRPVVFSKSIIFAVAMITFFYIDFAIFKDISDVAGDKLDGIQSLAILWGEKRVFMICVSLLEMAYLAAMLVGATLSNPWSKYLTITSHAAMALILWNRVRSFDYSGPTAYKSFYLFLWKLFCVEYALVQFVR
ncbi:PREDICTED: homogentisate phytyltransferase 1, chloroplastic-like isoform X2 [Ipomoea nil]|uniref:homogentisate phytyltransferase 1, chloroplastic-like isoform X1 n=1 Tax=Ipomoea nil TaxID=35883 RepID=UPI000900C72B|nr:PREDICTED: homogentisate phytyltransferase 1, chloroplastic-like isoform X1 [Ipomoea nil]XP_019167148.1 PREDICTED: homogentisate phytyltransferase 1, chloroplastic-like isoform X2 [Ipomoea nil]